jgi:hypothetical protein
MAACPQDAANEESSREVLQNYFFQTQPWIVVGCQYARIDDKVVSVTGD